MSTVGENISIIRKRLGWTQEELATKMGYKSKSTINKIELGINDIPQSKIVQFADVLGTTPAHLMGWNDEKNVPSDETDLNEGEKMLLELFRQVPEDKQELVLQMISLALKTK
jgi:transcriptional regulator with XRE-family HTH domain